MSILARYFFLFTLLVCLVGCQTKPTITHAQAKENDIHEKLVGSWTGNNYSGEHLTLHFGSDGTVLIQRTSAPDVHSFWRTDRAWLVVTSGRDALITSSDDYWSVWHIDDHELVFRRSFSTGGPPLRFIRL